MSIWGPDIPSEPYKMYFHIGRTPEPKRGITETAEYDGSEDLKLACTQLPPRYSAGDRKRILKAWCDFFSRLSTVRRLWLVTRVPQELFDAICAQSQLRALYIKWSGIKDLSRIEGLKSLTHLYLGSSGGVHDLTPLAKLPSLVNLTIDGNFHRVTDYAPIGAVHGLEELMICGDGYSNKKVKIASLSPFSGLLNLQCFVLLTATVVDKSYAPLTHLKKLRHVDLPYPRHAAESVKLAASLPNLQSGNILRDR